MYTKLYTRNGKRWSINECLRLQREYELLELSLQEIALRHMRSPLAIIYKLSEEGFADFETLYNDFFNTETINNSYNITDNIKTETQTQAQAQAEKFRSLQQEISKLEKQLSIMAKLYENTEIIDC